MSLSAFWTAAIVPPTNLLALGLAGAAASFGRTRRLGRWLMLGSLLGLLLLSLPVVAERLITSLWDDRLAAPAAEPPAAIVILGGDVRRDGGRDATYDVGQLTLERVRRGATLARSIGLPVLVTGGELSGGPPIADLMARSLHDDFGIAATWIEPLSADTFENAARSAVILRAHGIHTVYLVTHGWHMRRAALAFTKAGIATVAVPVRIDRNSGMSLDDFLPRAEAWLQSYYGLHEWVGYADYALFR